MNKLLRQPSHKKPLDLPAKFEKFHLAENPFPSDPFINRDSTDKRINGNIYEIEIRRKEYEQIQTFFLKPAQSSPNHLRLGYIMDTSYIGRGNGKSAFLINLQQVINAEYCLDISEGLNKCFAVYVRAEPGGRNKTFPSFVDTLFLAIMQSGIIEDSLASLRLQALTELYPGTLDTESQDETALVANLNSMEWWRAQRYDLGAISTKVFENEYLQHLPDDFPLCRERRLFIPELVTQKEFTEYFHALRKGRERLDFVFSHLVQFFLAVGFNGAYILVDDFERIPDFQSERQKKDFALELRSCLFDGTFTNARVGFYSFLLVLHAGVPRLIADAWSASGMEQRAPIAPQVTSQHIVRFEKLSREHASLLLKKYLAEYRTEGSNIDPIFPFTEHGISQIGELAEYNAAKMLKMAYDLLEKAADLPGPVTIDESFVSAHKGVQDEVAERRVPTIEDAESVNLIEKVKSEN